MCTKLSFLHVLFIIYLYIYYDIYYLYILWYYIWCLNPCIVCLIDKFQSYLYPATMILDNGWIVSWGGGNPLLSPLPLYTRWCEEGMGGDVWFQPISFQLFQFYNFTNIILILFFKKCLDSAFSIIPLPPPPHTSIPLKTSI